MASHNTIFKFKTITSLLLFVLFFAGLSTVTEAAADAVASTRIAKAESFAIAAKGLSRKLQNDLALKNVSVKFNQADSYIVSKTQIGIRGEGIAQFNGNANNLPVNFDVKVDISKRVATEVQYVFLNMEGAVDAYSAPRAEDIVTEKLLRQIKNDYKTENIVIAVDYVEDQVLADDGGISYTGTGEVRMNGMEWRKISFDVKNGKEKSSTVKYQIK